jgi:hypothetical protein
MAGTAPPAICRGRPACCRRRAAKPNARTGREKIDLAHWCQVPASNPGQLTHLIGSLPGGPGQLWRYCSATEPLAEAERSFSKACLPACRLAQREHQLYRAHQCANPALRGHCHPPARHRRDPVVGRGGTNELIQFSVGLPRPRLAVHQGDTRGSVGSGRNANWPAEVGRSTPCVRPVRQNPDIRERWPWRVDPRLARWAHRAGAGSSRSYAPATGFVTRYLRIVEQYCGDPPSGLVQSSVCWNWSDWPKSLEVPG